MHIEASAVSDITGLVTDVRVFARVGEAPYTGDADTVTIEAANGSVVSYYVEAVGPGGSVVAREGTEGAPRSIPVGAPIVAETADEGGNTALWVTLIIVGALAVAGGVVAAVLLTQEQDTAVQPMIRF